MLKIKRLLVSGSRTGITKEYVYSILSQYIFETLRFGDAKGVDTFVHEYCHEFDIPHEEPWVPLWILYKKGAAIQRNKNMVETLEQHDYGICIWDGLSPGTKDTMTRLKHRKKLLKVHIQPTKHQTMEKYLQ